MDVLRMAFSNDRDLAVLCRPMQPKVEATPFTDSDDKSPKVTMHTLKLVSDMKSSSVCSSVIMYMPSNSSWALCLVFYRRKNSCRSLCKKLLLMERLGYFSSLLC